jgi:F0F1-type ATP synthase assembly protein I
MLKNKQLYGIIKVVFKILKMEVSNMVKKLCSILMIIMLLLNSSLLTIISTAVEDVSNTEKISMDLSYTQLTNRTQNEITITGVLERDSNEDPLYENPLVTFEFPAEVDKVVINDIKLLYDSELKIGDYTIEKNTEGKNIIKIPLIGKQTKYQTDGIIKGTNIRLSVNLLVKQDIKTTDSSVIMTCVDGIDENKKVSCKKDIKIINTYEIAETSVSADNIEGTKTTINGIDIITKAILGNNELKNGDVIYSNEIVKYEITVSNTREENVENMRIFSNIPEGMTYVEYDKEAFSFWNEKYTGLETGKADPNGVYWQDDTYQYVVDNNLKAKEINIGTLQKGESKTYSYELKVNSTENDKNIENTIEILENENVIYTYKMSNKAMAGELEVRMRQYQSRTEKNEFSYNVIVKNLTNEDKSAVATLNIPDIAEIKSVRGSYGTEISYEQKDGNLIINLSKIPASSFASMEIVMKANITEENQSETYQYATGISIETMGNNSKVYNSNQCIASGWIESVKIVQNSETSGEKVKEFKEITYIYDIENTGYVLEELGGYTTIKFEDYIPKELSVKSIEYNNFIVEKKGTGAKGEYVITNTPIKMSSVEVAQVNGKKNENEPRLELDLNIQNGGKIQIKIVAEVKAFDSKQNNIEISNMGIVSGEGLKTKQSNIIQNTLVHPKTTNVIEVDSNGNIIDGGNTPTPTPTPDNTQNTKAKYSISGVAWIDADENGRRDNDETLKDGVEVLLYDVTNKKFVTDETGKVLSKKTDKDGKYSFTNIYVGQYYVVFKYDTDMYGITDYQRADVLNTENNDAVEKYARIFDETRTIGMTDTINLNSYKNNIDLGLVEKKNFDLKLEQYIQKITVTNSKGTKEYNYNNKKFAKISIHSKQFVGSTVVVEYKVVITNIGDLTGKVYEILDEIPSKMDFHSEINDGWTKSLSYTISNISFVNNEIKPGESIETTVTLSKTLQDGDPGVYTNIAKINSAESLKHKEDSNMENNSDKTEIMIEVATGTEIAFKLIGGVIMGLLYIALMIYFIRKVVNKKGMFVIFAIIFGLSMFSFTTKEYAYSIEGTIADAKAEIQDMVDSAVAEKVANMPTQVQIVLSGYNGQSGSGTFFIYSPDGTYIGKGECLTPGSHFHTIKVNGDPIVDENGKIIGYEEKDQDISVTFDQIGAVKCDYIGPKDVHITSTSFSVTGADPNGGTLEWTNDGFDFSLSGDIPGEFSAKETSALWNAIGSVIDPTNLGTYDMDKIQSAVNGATSLKGSATAEMLTGSDGVTSLSVTVTRNITVTITVNFAWTNEFRVSADYKCPNCGATTADSQTIGMPASDSVTKSIPYQFSTTITFTPEELPKSLTIYKFDEETGEMLYDPEDPSLSKFKFLVKGNGGEWTVGVGESITGLYAGTYQVWEIDSPYGYGVWEDNYDKSKYYKKLEDIVINQSDVIVIVKLYNKKQFIDLSGYVWEDMVNGKDNTRNDLYDEPDARVPGVKVILHDTVRNRELVTWTNENGEYHFGSRNEDLTYTDDTLRIADLDKYYIEFEYNGVKYRNVKLNPDVNVTNASRASEEVASGKSDEDSSVRQRFNERFSTISSGTQIDSNGESTGIVIDTNGNVNSDKISYTKNGEHQSQINYGKNMTEANGNKEAYGENIYHIKATTYKNLNLSNYLEGYIKKENTTIAHVNEIKNINLGLYSREQVDVAVDSDVARFVLNVNGYQHTYKYATLVNPDTQEEMDVKLKALKGKYYERQLHESTISYSATPDSVTPEGVSKLYADITYKIYLQNKSNSSIAEKELTAKIKELTLNYDEDLKIISYGYEGSNVNTEVSESEITSTKNGAGTVKLKEATIDLEKLEDRKISAGKREVLEVTFRTDANTIAKILNNPTGIKFDFMAEVKTYSTYANNEENAFNRAEGIYAYASIDKNSAARNAQVQIDTDDSFVTDTFENDTTIAPTFKLSKGTQTELSGIVYEDSPKQSTPIKIDGNDIYERVGDGIYNNENVMANVLVELLSVPMENGQYDSDTARTGENGRQEYDVAKLYQENKTTQGETSKVLARTYTNEKGEYKFEGLVAGNYVIKYTYGKNMKDVDENGNDKETIRATTAIYTSDGNTKLKEIEAREYKSTVITSGEISNAMNITDGKAHLNGDYSWFLKNPETRYSDAVDDVEYRANLEKEAKINYEILKGTKTYVYENMEAYTPYFKLGVEEFNDQQSGATLETQEDGTLNYVFTIDNVDFGLIERPIVDLQVDKVITGLKVSLGNGQVLINGDPSKESLPYVRTGLDDFVPIEIDTELLQNATIEEEYTIRITNNSELDYSIYPIWGTDNTQKVALRRNYYYYGTQEGLTTDEAVTTRIDVLGDYIGSELTADESTMPEWNKRAIEELTSYNGTNLFTTENDGKKEKTLRDGKYTIYTTNTFNNPNEEIVTIGQTKSIAYKVSRLLAVNTDTMKYTNDVEILQYSGYSQNKDRTENTYNRVKDTTPGNLVPGGAMEDDEDSVRTTITPPTGTIISRWLYVTTVAAGLILVGATIIFIRKRVLVK